MMKRSIRLYCETSGSDKWACLLEQLVGNVGIVFTIGECRSDEVEACLCHHTKLVLDTGEGSTRANLKCAIRR